jgi:hypothetical protein
VNQGVYGGGALTDILPCTAGMSGSVEVVASGHGIATIAMWVYHRRYDHDNRSDPVIQGLWGLRDNTFTVSCAKVAST